MFRIFAITDEINDRQLSELSSDEGKAACKIYGIGKIMTSFAITAKSVGNVSGVSADFNCMQIASYREGTLISRQLVIVRSYSNSIYATAYMQFILCTSREM